MSAQTTQSFPEPDYVFDPLGYFVLCDDRAQLEKVCDAIDKKHSGIYLHKTYKCWTVRLRSKVHRNNMLVYFIRKYLHS